jgi:hypothetical protein
MAKKIDDVMLERIIDLAIAAGYKPKDPPLNDVMGQLEKSALELMLVRFAYRIAKELES